MATANRHPFLNSPVPWHFPLAHTHDGIPLGNGTFGALVSGEGSRLRITINRQDYWDHRGGVAWGEEATYQNLKAWLELGDEENLRRVFEGESAADAGDPPRPTRLPMGRVDIQLPAGSRLKLGSLNLGTSEATLEVESGPGLRALLVRHDPVVAIEIDATDIQVLSCPPDAPEVLDHFRRYGFPPADVFEDDSRGGWVQECPGEPAMCVAWERVEVEGKTELLITSVFGETPDAARQEALQVLSEHHEAGYSHLAKHTGAWWDGYWSRVAALAVPDDECGLLYYLGMYKLAGLSVPGSPAATLQGPWVEEYCMPPWSADYHFNINVQESYWPAYGGNFISSLEPLWEMIESWKPLLRANARTFAGVPDGLQLPHAVDDRGTCMGGFWTGSIDHGSTAWVGQLMWQRWRYTMDLDFLRDTVYPYLKGTMRVYEAMLEDDGTHWSLPVSVSPEFGGAGASAWGRDASFQLANIHFLCRTLVEAAELLDLDPADCALWQDTAARLPLCATGPDGADIWLWDGQPLSESHRHHSHLAGLYPFDNYDYWGNPAHRALLDNSFGTLVLQGMGLWTGWCTPWAAILWARLGNGEMAQVLLNLFRRVFMGPGYASTHDGRIKGFTVMTGRPEIMQIEASMGAAAAVMELLVQCSRGLVRVFAAVPHWWRDVSFEGIRTEEAFLVSGRKREGEIELVRIISEAGAPLRMQNPFAAPCLLERTDGTSQELSGDEFNLQTTPGEELAFRPQPAVL